MEQNEKKELIDIWRGINLLGPDLDEKNLEVVIRNYDLYKDEIILMANLRRISKYLKNSYTKITEFINENREYEGKVIELIENVKNNKNVYRKDKIASLKDYAEIFITAIRYLEIEENRRENIIMYKCQRDDGEER
jgi:hypothetical protein